MAGPRSNTTRPHVRYSPLPAEASVARPGHHSRGPSLRLTRSRSYHDDVDDDEENLEGGEMGNEDANRDESSPVDKPSGGYLDFTHIVLDNTLSKTDRKVAIVAVALEETGMGKYQWCIFFLCGYGYMLDLMWAGVLGIVMPRVQIELNIPDAQYGDIFSLFSAGLTVGAFTWGLLVDIIGRRWAFNLTVAITSVFGICLPALNSWSAMMTFTFFIGFGLGGNIPIDATIVLEFIPQSRRWLLVALSAFQPFGFMVCSLIAWGLVPKYACDYGLKSCKITGPGEACCTKASNYGWRYTLFCIGGISVLGFFARFVVFNFRESPRFLVSRGRDEEAVAAIHSIARTNGRTSSLRVEDLRAVDDDSGDALPSNAATVKRAVDISHLKALFSSVSMAKLTILTWIVYMADYWGFTIAGTFLPKLLAERGAAADQSISTTYRNYLLTTFPGIFGVALGAALVEIPTIGRRWSMVVTSALMAASLFAYAKITTPAASVGFNAMEYFFQSAFNAVLYGWTPEAFPAYVRGSACGLASFWGRLMSIVAPIIAAHAGAETGIYLAGGGVFICTVLAVFLPETRRGIRET